MSLALRQIKVYTKFVALLIVALAVGAVLFKNRHNTVVVWFFGIVDSDQPVNVVWLLLCTAVGSIVCWSALRMGLSLIKDTREVQRQRQARQREKSQQELAQRLREQEKRIDEKINTAIKRDAEDT